MNEYDNTEGTEGEGGGMDSKEFLESLTSTGIKTFKAATGTVYATVATDGEKALAITPKIYMSLTNPVMGLMLRVRVQTGKDSTVEPDGFGFPELVQKSDRHASTDIFIAAGLLPLTKYQLGEIIASEGLIEKMVDTLFNRLESVAITPRVSKDVLVEYIRNIIEDNTPSSPPKKINEFPVAVGNDSIAKRLGELYEEFGKKVKSAE